MAQHPAQVRREHTSEDEQLRADGGPKSLNLCVRRRQRIMPSEKSVGPMGMVVELGGKRHEDRGRKNHWRRKVRRV